MPANRLGTERVAAEPAAVDQIVTRCARLPLALAIAAGRAALRAHLPLADLAAQPRDTQTGWTRLPPAGEAVGRHSQGPTPAAP